MAHDDEARLDRADAMNERRTPAGAIRGGEEADPGTGGRREWNRHEWAAEASGDDEPQRWNRHEWAGEPPDPSDELPGGAMPPGAGGPQGFGHNPSEQHWVPLKEERPER